MWENFLEIQQALLLSPKRGRPDRENCQALAPLTGRMVVFLFGGQSQSTFLQPSIALAPQLIYVAS